MHMRTLILFTLSTFTASCVAGGGDCDSLFTLDEALTEADVASLLQAQELTDRQAIECEAACVQIADHRDRLVGEDPRVETCTITVDAMAGTADDDVVGSLQCEGKETVFCEGRRPLGHVEARNDTRSLGGYLARCAQLEAASVIAFEQLAERLERWGAPAELVDRCRRAAADEVVHAREVGAFAARLGAVVPVVERRSVEPSILELALHNAAEGCVHEAWAAMRAAWVARHACEPELQALYARIADDEAQHAQLSWELHRWLRARLDQEDRARVDATLERAIDGLRSVVERQARLGPADLGMPGIDGTIELARRFGEGLRAAAIAA